MSFENMISGRGSGHSSTDDDHISVSRDCLCSPMPDQRVVPSTLEPKRERRLGMREPNSRSICDRMHLRLDGTGEVTVRDRDSSSASDWPRFSTHRGCTRVSKYRLLLLVAREEP